MIKKIRASAGEKILFIFLILLAITSFFFYFTIKNKCLFVEKVDLQKIIFPNTENIVVMNVECGEVIIELLPNLSPNSVERFKFFVSNGYYDGSAFYRVIKDTLIQAGDLEYGNVENIDYYRVGSGKSKLGLINSEINNNFEFKAGSIGLVRGDAFNTEDSEFFILLKDIPLFNGEYTPIGNVIYGLDALTKIKSSDKTEYVLRPDFLSNFKLLKQYN
ncbi:peptidylprolyl isomerase [Candidatus Pelagibacter sp.]|nr:peptidylprolyl isomerase [Candidatus Pelagibacter sp.]|tara:strand:- start:17 stop:670 length:654 start_codon:yes stop_codon:yes gene_type:complete